VVKENVMSITKLLGAVGAAIWMAQSANALALDASYEVPVEQSLRDHAQFDLPPAFARVDADTADIRYYLPRDITGGREIHIGLLGTYDEETRSYRVHEEASGAAGSCVKTTSTVTCMLSYSRLGLDEATGERYLSETYRGDAGLEGKIGVMRVFAHDAVGILTVELRKDQD
jgi:hypothetical protein